MRMVWVAMYAVLLVGGSEAVGTSISPLDPLAGLTPEGKAMAEVLGVYEKAYNTNDPKDLVGMLDVEFAAVTLDGSAVKDFGKLKEQWDTIRKYLGDTAGHSIQFTSHAAMVRGETAVMEGEIENHVAMSGGEKIMLPARYTAVFSLRDGKWKLLRLHTSIDPFSNPFVEARLAKSILAAGIPAALVALITGCGVTWAVMKGRLTRKMQRMEAAMKEAGYVFE